MAVLTDYIFVDILLVVLPILYFVYWFITRNNGYWDSRGVPNVKTGTIFQVMLGKKSQLELSQEMYKKFENEKYAGYIEMSKPVLLVRDPELINRILVKDFIHFQDRGNPQFKNDPLSQSLFSLQGHIWRALRYKLTPTFTTGKLRGMFEQISKSGDNMMEKIHETTNTKQDIESKSFLFEFTLDVICSCAFGLQVSLNSHEFNMFKATVQKMFSPSLTSLFKFGTALSCPKLADFCKMTSFPKNITEYFVNLTRVNWKYRKDNNIHRNDYFQLLLTLKDEEDSGKVILTTPPDATEDDDVIINQMRYTEEAGQVSHLNIKLMSEETITANSFIFLTAGSESTANTISLTLLNLAQHPDIQKQLQQEVDTVLKHRGGWSFDTIKDMTYLDQIVQETQRMFPLISMLLRECVLPYKIPDSDLIIEKGVLIGIPVIGLHMDPLYYPEPDRFNPERFQGNNFKPNATFLPFGDGPRMCIAMRFAVMEVKTCLARIMSQYTVTLSPKTQTPLKFIKRAFFPTVEGGIWLNFEKRMVTK